MTLVCFCSVLTPLIQTHRLCYHRHPPGMGGAGTSVPVGGHEEAKICSGMLGKVSELGRFSRTDSPVNKRAGDSAGEAFLEGGLC